VAFVALAAHALHAAFGVGGARLDGFFDEWVYNGLIGFAGLTCASRAIFRRAERAAWSAFALALCLWSAADISWTALYANDATPPYPSLSDGLWLAFYPAAYAGLILLVRSRARNVAAALWIDGMIAALAAATIGAAVLFQAVLASSGGTTAEVATNLAYPIGDIVLFALLVAALALAGWRPSLEWTLIGASFLATAIADGIYLFESSMGTYLEGTILDTLWPASAILLAFASWQPSHPARAVESRSRRAFAIPLVLGLVAIGVLAYDHVEGLNHLAVALAVATLLAVIARTAATFRENLQILERIRRQSVTDDLTGIGNRRLLLADLEAELAGLAAGGEAVLLLFDLDGFKHYNDTYGHPVGDALLARLGGQLVDAVVPNGRAYRLGGDEFCVLASAEPGVAARLIDRCTAALCEESEGFSIGTSFGAAFLPEEATSAAEALRIADQRLYAHKQERRRETGRQPEDVVLRALYEREPRLAERARAVAALATAAGRRLGLGEAELGELARAAQLHDIGKLAVPDAILHKTGSLDPAELRFIHNHSSIGARILSASPALTSVARIVRYTHERWDGTGYPDGLAGNAIPIGARIVAACDAYCAMTSERPHRPAMPPQAALGELRRCAGGQFDPAVVEALVDAVRAEPTLAALAPAA
jgi:diguanylate cyclase (GGDEF)-like protein